MQLLTKELEARFKEIGSQEANPDPIVIAKYFNPSGAGTWYATEYIPEDKRFFGYVSIIGGGTMNGDISHYGNWKSTGGISGLVSNEICIVVNFPLAK